MAAIAFVKNVATKSTSNATTCVFTIPAAGVALGDVLVLRFAATSNSAGLTVSSIVDTGSNTYTLQDSETQNNRFEYLYWAPVTTALVSGNTVTVTFSAKVNNHGILDQFSGLTNTTEGTPASNTAAGTTPSQAITTTSANDLVYSHIMIEVGSADSFTGDADSDGGDTWHEMTTALSSTNYISRGAYKITTSSGTFTYNPTLGTSRTYGVIVAAKQGTDQAAPSAFPFKSEAGATLKRL